MIIDWHFYRVMLYLPSLLGQYIIKARLPEDHSGHEVSMVTTIVPIPFMSSVDITS